MISHTLVDFHEAWHVCKLGLWACMRAYIIHHIVTNLTSAVCFILFLFCTFFTDIFNMKVVTKTTITQQSHQYQPWQRKSTKIQSNLKFGTVHSVARSPSLTGKFSFSMDKCPTLKILQSCNLLGKLVQSCFPYPHTQHISCNRWTLLFKTAEHILRPTWW